MPRPIIFENSSVTLWLTQTAYRKTLALVMGFSDEVGWHGTVTRTKDDEFIIEDTFVYPQEVTGSTVNTDQNIYTEWLYSLDDDTFNKLRMQSHSHVNMGVSPSGVDNKHRQQILDQLESDMFYVFMVWNKALSVHTLVYDMAANVLYEDDDVEIKLLGDEDMNEFLADAMEKVQKSGTKKNITREQLSLCEDFDELEYTECKRFEILSEATKSQGEILVRLQPWEAPSKIHRTENLLGFEEAR